MTDGTTTTRRTTIDGVTVLWEELDVDPEVRLVFAVGHRDDGPAVSGLAEVAVELVKDRVTAEFPEAFLDANLDRTIFAACGTHDERTRFVALVCEALTQARTADDDVLEGARSRAAWMSAARADALSLLFGAEDLGLDDLHGARSFDWTPAEIREHVARHFHTGTATLVLAEAPWEGLRAPLPAGSAPSRRAVARRVPGRTVQVGSHDDYLQWVGATSGTSGQTSSAVAFAVLERALGTALETVGIDGEHLFAAASPLVDGDVWQVEVDIPSNVGVDAVREFLRVADRLATAGPTTDEIAAGRDLTLERHEEPYGRIDELEGDAVRGSLGTLRDGITAGSIRAVTDAEVHEVLREVGQTMVASVPGSNLVEETVAAAQLLGWTLRDATDDPAGRSAADVLAATFDGDRVPGPGTPQVFSTRRWRPHRGHRVAVATDRIVLAADGRVRTVLLDELVLIGSDRQGEVELVTSRGGVLVLAPARFRGLRPVLDAALARASRAKRYDKSRLAPAGFAGYM